MKVITVPNLGKYQHYKNRKKMPWIKWHKECLRDYKFCQLRNCERWIFVGLVILAMENDNEIPADFHYIATKISYSFTGFNKIMLKLLDLKLIAIKRIAKRYQEGKRDEDEDVDIDKEKKKILPDFNKYKNGL